MPRLAADPLRQQPRTAPPIELITMRIPDACRYTGISRSTLYVLIAKGQVEIIKLGSSTLVITDSLRKLIAERRRRSVDFASQA